MPTIKEVTTDVEILACYDVLSELRPGMSKDTFLERVKKQMFTGYQLACLIVDLKVSAVIGWRVRESLAMDAHLYIEDLVTASSIRSKGYGDTLLNHVVEAGKSLGCEYILLDSGVQRFKAHKFYLREDFEIKAYLFVKAIA